MSAIFNYDTGPLNWVRSDIETALQAALGRVQAFSADADLTNALRLARDDAHQVAGALRMVGLEGAATVAATLENVLADINDGRQMATDEVFGAVRNAIEGLSRWIKELAEGRGNGELALFPTYKRLRELQGAEHVFEGELFFPDLRVRTNGFPVVDQTSEALAASIKVARAAFQRGLLAFLRGQGAEQGLMLMRQALSDVESSAPTQAAQTFWWACVGFVDGLIAQGVEADFYVKQLLARIDLQMRRLMEGSPQVAERLLRDALFFVAKSQMLEGRAAEVRATFSLDQYLPGQELLDPEAMARMRPVLDSLKTDINSARDIWRAQVEGAESEQNEDFQTHIGRMQGRASLLGSEAFLQLLNTLSGVASVKLNPEQQEMLNLEIAATLLFLQNAVDSEEILRSEFSMQANGQNERLRALSEGRTPPKSGALLDARSQAVADRDLLHHLAKEVSSNLKQIEEVLDIFFRDEDERDGLNKLAGLSGQAQGALNMLELHDAALLLGAAVNAAEAYTTEGCPSNSEKSRIADAFSCLGLYIEAHCAGRMDAARVLQPVLAEFGLPVEKTLRTAATEDSVEAGLDRRKSSVAAAYLEWREEGGEEPPKKFLEVLIELGRDAELIDDTRLKRGVGDLLAASRAAISPDTVLDVQVAALTNVTLPERIELTVPEVVQCSPCAESVQTQRECGNECGKSDFDLSESVESTLDSCLSYATFEHPVFCAQIEYANPLSNADSVPQMVAVEALNEGSLIDADERVSTPESDDVSLTRLCEGVDSPVVENMQPVVMTALVAMEPSPADDAVMAIVPEESDPELLEIFLEEADEVLAAISVAVDACHANQNECENLTVIRRAFHTLKGSGRMVGLVDLGEAAWSMEQFMNAWLAEGKPGSPEFLDVVSAARQIFQDWVSALRTGEVVKLPVTQLLSRADQIANPIGASLLEETVVADGTEERPAKNAVEVSAADLSSAEPTENDFTGDEISASEALVCELSEWWPGDAEFCPVDNHDTDSSSDTPSDVYSLAQSEIGTYDVVVGNVHLSKGLFDIFIGEAQQRLLSMEEEIARLDDEGEDRSISEMARRAAHTLGGIAGTAGFSALSELAHALELYWNRFESKPMPVAHRIIVNTIIQRLGSMMDQIAVFLMPDAANDLIAALGELEDEVAMSATQCLDQIESIDIEALLVPPEIIAHERSKDEEIAGSGVEQVRPVHMAVIEYAVPPPVHETTILTGYEISDPTPAARLPAELESGSYVPGSVGHVAFDLTDLVPKIPVRSVVPLFERRDVKDDIDLQLLPIFLDEAEELVPDTGEQLRRWKTNPQNHAALGELRRNLHTLKGSARMVGAMRLGELSHVMESRVIAVLEGQVDASAADFDALESQLDRLASVVEQLKRGEVTEIVDAPPVAPVEFVADKVSPVSEEVSFVNDAVAAQPALRESQALTLRVRADWVDRMVNQAGEVAIARSRIESEVFNFKRHVGELSDALGRLRGHIREVEIQAESQMQSSFQTQGQGEHFDPLEFDRFTRFQEVTRFLAESVNDISTVQHIMLARLGEADAALLQQTRLNRELQQNLLRVRMVPLYSVAERLYRTVRQTARDVGKRAQLDIQGGELEIDRSVLEKITAPLEHLLRNALAHGVESPEARKAAGKTEFGEITLIAQQSGNEMLLIVKDDGAGLNFARIREKALAQGLLTPGIEPSDTQLAQMIFAAGFSTAEQVSEVSGRGVGMDVVKSEIAALGGRIDINSTPSCGTQFSIYLPLTLAMTQAVMFNAGKQDYALPTTLVQQVLELKADPLAAALAAREIEWRGLRYPLIYLPHLLGQTDAVHEVQRFNSVVLLRSGNSHAAILVDCIEGTREIVVKNIGPQLARVTGIAGATVRGDGRVVLILNPVPLALRWMSLPKVIHDHQITPLEVNVPEIAQSPLVLVVDDSLTVRKITGRLLTREGYRMDTAKDGIDALEKMRDLIPDVVLLDVEMPRMDGFELARVMRNDPRLKYVPIIMITSRTAEKHRNLAMEIGVNVYMGKPYQEQQLLDTITEMVGHTVGV